MHFHVDFQISLSVPPHAQTRLHTPAAFSAGAAWSLTDPVAKVSVGELTAQEDAPAPATWGFLRSLGKGWELSCWRSCVSFVCRFYVI